MSGLVFLAAALAAGILLARGRSGRAKRRREAHARGEAVRVPVRLAGEPPAPFVPGWVATGGPAPEWRPRRTGMVPVPLAGARLLRTDAPTSALRASEFVVTALLPDGTLVRLATPFPDLELVQDVVSAAGGAAPPGPVDLTKPGTPPLPYPPPYAPPPPPPGAARRPGLMPWWSVTLLGLAAGWAAIWAWFWLAGTVLDATVVSNPEGPGCQVEWTDPDGGGRQENKVDCTDSEIPGDTVRVLTLPPPMNGTATEVSPGILFPLLVGGLAVGAAGVGIVLRLLARRPPRGPVGSPIHRRSGHAPVRAGGGDVPRLGEGEVTWSRIAEVMAARAAAEGWAPKDPGAPATAPGPEAPPRLWWNAAGLRRLARRAALRLVVPAVIIGVAAGSGWGSWLTTARLASGDTVIAHGVVTRTADDALLPFLPQRALIHYRVDGRGYDTWVPVTHEVTRGQAVSVLHAADSPGRARYEGDGDGLPRQATVTGLVAGLAAILALRRITRTLGDLTALVRARRGPSRPWRYVRFVDHTGRPGVMLFSRLDDAAPVAVLPLLPDRDRPDLGPVSGEAQVHGEVGDGTVAVPVVDGRTCWPSGRAAALPPAVVRDLVNGTLPDLRARLTAGGPKAR